MRFRDLNLSLCAAALLAACGATPGSAADADGQFAVRGLGGQSCAQFIALVESEESEARDEALLSYISWTSGYLSYVNRSTEGIFDASPVIAGRDMLQMILNQCAQDPEALFENTAFAVFSALSAAAVAEASPLVTLEGAGQARQYRMETVIAAQAALIESGLLEGEPDGVVGPATTSALQRFQSNEGLEATGFLDFATLVRLLLR